MEKTQKELEEQIKGYATSYYSGMAEVSDDLFDALVDELRTNYPDSEILTTPGWGFTPRQKVEHKYGLKIASLPKVKDTNLIAKKYSQKGVRVSAKLDGLSVVSYYKNGKRAQCITRGNGTQGMDVTDKMNVIAPEQRTLSIDFTGAVRGEVVMPMSAWYEHYESLKAENPSMNPRNMASGILNRKEITDDLANLDYVVYKVLATDKKYTMDEVLDEFSKVPFVMHNTNDDYTEEELKSLYDEWNLIYPCDGVVLTIFTNGTDYDEDTRVNGYDEYAFKFKAETAEVVVKDVTYNVTRTGRMAPLIWFDPVELCGAMVQKCTGFNAKFIIENQIGKGAVIEVTRSNEVIPYICKVVTPADEVKELKVCPNCGTELVWNGVDLVCENENEAQLAQTFFNGMNTVDGVGTVLIDKIIDGLHAYTEDELVKAINNIVTDEKAVIRTLRAKTDINGDATWDKVKEFLNIFTQQIDKAQFLTSCNVKLVGKNTAQTIIEEYPGFIEDCKNGNINYTRIEAIKGLGNAVVEAIKGNETRIAKLAQDLVFKEDTAKNKNGFEVAITGALSMKRNDFEKLLNEHGIKISGSFKTIKYLITNDTDTNSSKMQKAKANGVQIINEADFCKIYF